MSILNVNQIQPVGGGNTITVSASDVSASGATIIASSFVGPVTGNASSATVATNAQGLTGTPDITVNNIQSGVVTATTFIGDGSGITGVTASGSGISIKDSASIVGVAATIDFSTNLNVSPASVGIVTVTVGDTDFAIADKIVHTGDTNTAIRFPAADTISAETSGTERLRVDSSGKLRVGPESSEDRTSYRTQLSSSDANVLSIQNPSSSDNSNINLAFFARNTNNAAVEYGRITTVAEETQANSTQKGYITFSTNNSASMAERLRITSDGKIGVNESNPGCLSGGIHLVHSDAEGTPTFTGGETAIFQRNFNSAQSSEISIVSGTASKSTINFGDKDDVNIGMIQYENNNNALVFTTNTSERLRITSDGSTYTGGSIITESDMNWGHDTYQRPHIFTGQSGGNPSDAAVVVASPETDPSATRIGSLIFGCKTSSGSGVGNSGLKAVIDCSTNTNVSDAWKTGAKIDFKTRLDNGNLALAQSISSDGQVTKPKQYQFLVETNGTSISQNAWNKLTGLSIDTNHTTGISDGTYWSNSNQRFTAPVTGTYKFFHGGYATIAATTNNDRYGTCFRINGGTLFYIAGGNYCRTDSPMNGHTIVYKLSANDYVELWYYSALAGNWGSGSHGIWWGGYLLG